VCYIVQLVLSGDKTAEDAKVQLLRGIEQLSQILVDDDSRLLLVQAGQAVLDDLHYLALKNLRSLLPREDRLLAVYAS
jgi:flagellar protein FlbT